MVLIMEAVMEMTGLLSFGLVDYRMMGKARQGHWASQSVVFEERLRYVKTVAGTVAGGRPCPGVAVGVVSSTG